MTAYSIFRPGYSVQEINDALACLRKWRDGELAQITNSGAHEEYPFVIGAVPVLLFAYEMLLHPEQSNVG